MNIPKHEIHQGEVDIKYMDRPSREYVFHKWSETDFAEFPRIIDRFDIQGECLS